MRLWLRRVAVRGPRACDGSPRAALSTPTTLAASSVTPGIMAERTTTPAGAAPMEIRTNATIADVVTSRPSQR